MRKQDDGVTGPDQYYYYTPSRYYAGGMDLYITNRNTMNLSMDGNYFAEGVLGGDHEIRFGVDYYTATTTTTDIYPNRRRLFIYDRTDTAGYKEIWWIRDYIIDVGFKRISAYLSDTITFGKLTANIGIRYDKETGSHNAATIPGVKFAGTPIWTSYLGDLAIPGRDVDAAYNIISPRLSFTYDITGDGKNVVKLSFGMYGGQSGNNIASHVWGAPWSEIDTYWNDIDGDLKVDMGEWDETYGTWSYWSIDPFDPYAVTSPNKFDPDFNSPILTEITLAYEKGLGEDVALGLNLFYKKTTNQLWYRGMFTVPMTGGPISYNAGDLETADNWYQKGTFTFQDGSTKPYYERYYVPNATYLTNHGSGWYTQYTALQFIFSKKLAGGWMLDASFTYADWKNHYNSAEYFDQTNFDYFQDGVNAPQSGGSGLTGIYVNARWQAKLSGLYQLPYGINITAVFQAREGYIIPSHETYRRGSGLGWTDMYEVGHKLGDDRLPVFWMLNMGLEKAFKVSDSTTVTLFIDGYNITNNSTTLKVESLIGTAYNEIQRILNPGVFQFGVRVSF
jgi:hypothetical protein